MLLKKKINFSKMHGLGNDFVIINAIKKKFLFNEKLICMWSNRLTGIGFDQLLIIESSLYKSIDYNYRIINSTGKEVEQCGNGARCLAYYFFLKKINLKKKISLQTKKNIIYLEYLNSNIVKVNMGKPSFLPEDIPFLTNIKKKMYKISLLNKNYYINIVSMGNPHCVIKVNNINIFSLKSIGKEISNYKLFPKGVNVGFMQIISKSEIKLRVFERHVGETQACGSGACAAVASGILNGELNNNVKVNLSGGTLRIFWKGEGSNLYMIGSANHVYDGVISYNINV